MNHTYWDVSDLNAPYDSIPLRGVEGLGAGSLSGNALRIRSPMRGLGALGDWVSDNNCKHSGAFNQCDNEMYAGAQKICYSLRDLHNGDYRPYADFDDCVQKNYGNYLRTCQQYCPGPAKKSGGGGGPPPVTSTKCPEGQFADASGKCVPIPPPRRSVMGGGKVWIIGGAVVAAVAIGGAVWYKMLKTGR